MVESLGIDITAPAAMSPEDEFSIEYQRLAQALRQAGIDIKSLSPMELGMVAAAMSADNTLFEEPGALLMMFRQTRGLADAMHLTDEERGLRKAAIDAELDEDEKALEQKRKLRPMLSVETQAMFQSDLDARSEEIWAGEEKSVLQSAADMAKKAAMAAAALSGLKFAAEQVESLPMNNALEHEGEPDYWTKQLAAKSAHPHAARKTETEPKETFDPTKFDNTWVELLKMTDALSFQQSTKAAHS